MHMCTQILDDRESYIIYIPDALCMYSIYSYYPGTYIIKRGPALLIFNFHSKATYILVYTIQYLLYTYSGPDKLSDVYLG